MKHMKKQNIIVTVLGVLIVILVAVGVRSSDENKLTELRDEVLISNDQMCFLYEDEAQVDPEFDVPDAYNREYVELTMSDDGNVAGTHNIIPFEKDSNFATLIGVTDGSFVNVIATANEEGETWREQRIYQIDDDKLLVGYQPMYVPRYENENEIFMYEDINKIVFETEEFFLPKVDCDSVDKDTVL
ncbi:MAG: hypothetical protein ACJAV6_000384 [Candidatus Paceibacteria bacterium]|jgi:hypothetical protein